MTPIRAHLRRDRGSKSSTLEVVAVVCLVLLVVLAAAQVVHTHPIASNGDHCPLCIAMHSAVPLLVLEAAVVLVRFGTAAPVLLEIRAIIRHWYPSLFTRPPPTGC